MARWSLFAGASVLLVAIFTVLLVRTADGVDRSKFRTCAQTGFCKRQRDKGENVSPGAGYHLVADSVSGGEGGEVNAQVHITGGNHHPPLELSLEAYKEGVLRVRLVERTQNGMRARYESPDILKPDVDGEKDGLDIISLDGIGFHVRSKNGKVQAKVKAAPFSVDVLDDSGEIMLSINAKGLLHFEQRSPAREQKVLGNSVDSDRSGDSQDSGKNERKIIDWGEDGKPIYEDGGAHVESDAGEQGASADSSTDESADAPESFGGHTDSKPHGATAVGVDIEFPGVKHIFGLPEHATDFNLKSTKGAGSGYDEPFRMYNLDVFEYEIDVPMALYGHIPAVVAHSAKRTTGAFWNNPSETFVDVADVGDAKQVHWMSESGVFDMIVSVGPSPSDVFRQYASMTGVTPTPPMFSLGYHQCRWNYRDEKDVREVNAEFEAHDLPYDVIWLDIEHTDGKRYFTWDKDKFPTPEDMQANIVKHGRKMVTIVDPHIKRDDNYWVHSEATSKGLYIKDKDGKSDFKGWCWPGDSSYLDFTSPQVRTWWAEQFAYDRYKGSTEALYTWNDMNEPSVFNGPEVSMTKEARSLAGVEHREWHNLYGFYQQMATSLGQTMRSGAQRMRSFVLSRAFFAGSQRVGAIWTGDNAAEWSHLQIASHMLLSLGVAGLPFAGADVGGFFNNPDTELMERWYQAAAYQPFFRAHAHIDTKRREPWLFGDEVLGRISKSIRARYALLPYWYTVFREHEEQGLPVIRPLWSLAPTDENTFSIGDAWLVGHELLVKPVTEPGVESAQVYLPKGFKWYQFEEPHTVFQGGQSIAEPAPLDKIPVFQRGGSIVPTRMRLRRSSHTMRSDPYTLKAALDDQGNARGTLYVDDELTFAYKDHQKFCEATFSIQSKSQTIVAQQKCNGGFHRDINVERIVVLGVDRVPSRATTKDKQNVPFVYDPSTRVLVLRKPQSTFLRMPFTITLA